MKLVPCSDQSVQLLHWLLVGGVVVLCGGLTGCEPKPRAPALRAGPVYHHKQLGFRFLVPDGWSPLANSNLPNGPLDKEICLAQFRVPSPSGASLEVLCFDRAYASDIPKYHGEPSQGVQDWQQNGAPAELSVEGAKGERLTFLAGAAAGQRRMKEVTYFVRGERIFSFVALAAESDLKSREEMERAVRSLVWDK